MLAQRIKSIASTIVLAMTALTLQASAFVLPAHTELRASLDRKEPTVVATAFGLLQSDFQRILDVSLQTSAKEPQFIIGSMNGPAAATLAAAGIDLSWLNGRAQAFVLAVNGKGQLVLAGSDAYGTAYGLMEMSRILGVSPWEWWADVVPETRTSLTLPENFRVQQASDVTFRGIHISDIDWGLGPWSSKTFDPSSPYTIGLKTARRIFELMLRLRLNLFWPPASSPQTDFFATRDGHFLAQTYGIFLGHDMEHPVEEEGVPAPLMFSDDGYGYLTRFPTAEDAQRNGGCGVYYHASYKGAPQDYLWLGTASPFLLYQQLTEAYYHGALRLWVLNVGDIKPCEYQTSLFADLAWDINAVRQMSVARHLEEFYALNVGRDIARLASIYMKEFYHLSFQCKPEHLAGTRIGESDPVWQQIRDLPWSEKKIRHRLTRYDQMQRNVEWLLDSVYHYNYPHYDSFFQLVGYPVLATIEMNLKFLLAQLARHGISWLADETVKQTWRRSDLAFYKLQQLTKQYNSQHKDKLKGMMTTDPTIQPVFKMLPHEDAKGPMPAEQPAIATFYGASYQASSFSGSDVLDPVLGLGASIRAIPIPKDCNVTYKYNYNYGNTPSANVELHLLPTHPIETQQRLSVTLDGGAPIVLTYDAQPGTEEWKQNVLRNYAVVLVNIPVILPAGEHQLVVTALDEGVVLDEVFIRP